MAPDNFVVLGASGGIGSETCRRLRSLGSNLLLLGRDQDALQHLGDELAVPSRVVDATSLDEVTEAVLAESHNLGTVNGIVNCVGSTLLKPAHLTSTEWHDTAHHQFDLGLQYGSGGIPGHEKKWRGNRTTVLRSRRTRAGKPRGNRSCQGGGRGTNAFRSGVLRPTSNPRQCRCTRSGTNPLERAHLVQPQTANRIPSITCCGAGWSATGCGFYHHLAAGTRQRLGYWPGIWHRRWAQHATCSPETRSVSKDGQRGG